MYKKHDVTLFAHLDLLVAIIFGRDCVLALALILYFCLCQAVISICYPGKSNTRIVSGPHLTNV